MMHTRQGVFVYLFMHHACCYSGVVAYNTIVAMCVCVFLCASVALCPSENI